MSRSSPVAPDDYHRKTSRDGAHMQVLFHTASPNPDQLEKPANNHLHLLQCAWLCGILTVSVGEVAEEYLVSDEFNEQKRDYEQSTVCCFIAELEKLTDVFVL